MIKIPFEYRITGLYIIIGALWILFSDKFLLGLTTDPDQILLISTYKGWFYVIVTGIFLYLLIKKEISRRNEVYNKLLEANKKAVESEQLKAAFLANISHYIRTPMNSILGFVELLENQNIDERKRELFMSVINDQSQYLLQLLNNIIDVSKLQEGQMELSHHPFSLNSMCERLESGIKLELAKKKLPVNLSLSLFFSKEDDLTNSDQQKIQAVMENLLQNAIKHSQCNQIKFGYTLKDAHLIFFVTDNGIGIPKDKIDYYFSGNLFTRNALDCASDGIGLGFYLSQKLIALMGGEVWATSSTDKGTTISFSIPYHPVN